MTSEPSRPGFTRAEWALLLVLALIQFTHMVDFVMIMPLGQDIMAEFGITPAQFGHVISAYGLSAAVASLLAASVIDRFDRRTVVLTLYAGFAVSTLFCGLARSYETLLLTRALAGAFGGLAAAGIMAVVGDVFADARRGRATGVVMSAFAAASIFGMFAGLRIAADHGRGAPFVVLAALSVGVWAVGWKVLPSLRGHIVAERRSAVAEFAAVVRPAAHRWAFVFTFCLVLGTFTVATFIGPVMTTNHGLSKDELGIMYMVAGVLTLGSTNLAGRLADRFDRLTLFRVMAGLAAVMTVVITNVSPGGLVGGCLLMAGFMVVAAGRMVPAQALLVGVPPAAVRGGFLSLNAAIQHVATGVAPEIAGHLMETNPDGTLSGFPLVGVVGTAAAVLSIVLAGMLRKRPVAAPVSEGVVEGVVAPEPAAA